MLLWILIGKLNSSVIHNFFNHIVLDFNNLRSDIARVCGKFQKIESPIIHVFQTSKHWDLLISS